MKSARLLFKSSLIRKASIFGASVVVGGLGLYLVLVTKAATYVSGQEAEAGIVSSASLRVADNLASGGASVMFSAQSTVGGGGNGGARNVNVSTATQLSSALADAKAGDTIILSDGTYAGQFSSIKSGTAQAPITLTGSRKAIINGGPLGGGYTLSLGTKNSTTTVNYWKFSGFVVTGGQKGIMWDNVQRSVIDAVLVQNIGHEGIHLRNNSSNNIVKNSTVTKTGQDTQAYGEGLYVGSAASNWGTFSQGKPDRSDNNQLLDNIVSFTGAENIDIKEGTHGGTIRGSMLDGGGTCYDTSADCNFADSMLDMKGEGWTIVGNTASHMRAVWKGGGAENDAFQVHVISQGEAEGSGDNNSFSGNNVNDVAGYGFNIQSKATGTVFKCDNTATNAGKGLSNIACR